MRYRYLTDPCHNFCILAGTAITDPSDGREKLSLSNFVDGGTGNIILIDRETGEGTSVPLPGDEGAWALFQLANGSLLVGTCGQYGYLHRFDLTDRTWDTPLRYGKEQYIWNLSMASDGMVYGGTWPGGLLLRYDPKRRTLESLGNPSGNTGNLYLKDVSGRLPGYVIASSGMSDTRLYAVNTANGVSVAFGEQGAVFEGIQNGLIRTKAGDRTEFYHPGDFSPADLPAPDSQKENAPWYRDFLPAGAGCLFRLGDGSVAGVCGQDYFILEKGKREPDLFPIPTQAPATRILTVIGGEDGRVWGSSAFGQTIFSYETEDGSCRNYPSVCSSGGEVYGMRMIRGRLFLSSYSHGDHIVYDPRAPWDCRGNKNPVNAGSVSPALIRPTGWSAVGPDGAFWTGWSARYGVYGGGLSRLDPDTLRLESWYDPVHGQQLTRMDADDKYLYFATNGEASGRAEKRDLFHFVVWDVFGRKIVKDIPLNGILHPYCVANAQKGRILLAADETIRVFSRDDMEFEDEIRLESPCRFILTVSAEEALLFCRDSILQFHSLQHTVSCGCRIPGPPLSACVCRGKVYFCCGKGLYQIE